MAGRGSRAGESGPDQRTTTEVIASVVVNAQALLAKEVELLGIELRGIVARKFSALGVLLTAGLAFAAVLGLGAVTLAIGLEDLFAERWHAWGIATLALLAVTLILLLVAGRFLASPWTPVRTRAQLDRTGSWLRGLNDELFETAQQDAKQEEQR